MGMAASQARFLGLTARKTNTEYEGQQVNQQRTGLANESSSLYNRMVALSVPIPPDTYDYYKNTYTFDYADDNDDTKTYTIKNYTQTGTDEETGNGIYNVTVKYTDSTSIANIKKIAPSVDSLPSQTTATDGTITTNNGSITVSGSQYALKMPAKNNALVKSWNDAQETEATKLAEDTEFYSYTNNAGVTNYIPSTAFGDPAATGNFKDVSDYYSTTQSQTKYDTWNNVQMAKDEDGNFYSLTYDDKTATTTGTNQMDDDAYSQAMNQYTLAKDRYDKEISDINAKTENIQQQDKTLELRLKQLDTEQSALQTELEAVTKVIEKNVESTFKTFA